MVYESQNLNLCLFLFWNIIFKIGNISDLDQQKKKKKMQLGFVVKNIYENGLVGGVNIILFI